MGKCRERDGRNAVAQLTETQLERMEAIMRKHTIKLLGLSLLAAVGVMAVSASAAQANYELLRNETAVESLELESTGTLGQLLAESGLTIHCPHSHSADTVEELNNGATVHIIAKVTYLLCTVVGNSFCTIGSSAGAEDKTIVASGSGEVTGHEGETYLGLAESESFATIYFDGVFCTLPESEVVSGSVLVSVDEAETSAVEHTANIDDEELFLGESGATLDGGEGTIEEIGGQPISIVLS